MAQKKTVYLGLSGGVDSAVAAVLLYKQGYRVIPIFMKCWSEESMGWGFSGECPWERDQRDTIAVCEKLGIADDFQTWNFEREYFENVIQPYLEDTKQGLTPNPDVTCNATIKFGVFFERAIAEGADFVATGHYARAREVRCCSHGADCETLGVPARRLALSSARSVAFGDNRARSTRRGDRLTAMRLASGPAEVRNAALCSQRMEGHDSCCRSRDCGEGKEQYQLLTAQCEVKNDQTYFLYRMTQEQLARTLFPIGEFGAKDAVRAYARERGLSIADKRSTRGICFVGKGKHAELIAHAVPVERGPIVTSAGKTVGEHEGVARYTIGQSKGLGIAIHGGPYYVLEKNFASNTLVVVPPADSSRLWQNEVLLSNVHWISDTAPELPIHAYAAIRHPQQDLAAPCLVAQTHADNTQTNAESIGQRKSASMSASVLVRFKEPQWAPTPGQSVVFYDTHREVVLGGGTIIAGGREA